MPANHRNNWQISFSFIEVKQNKYFPCKIQRNYSLSLWRGSGGERGEK